MRTRLVPILIVPVLTSLVLLSTGYSGEEPEKPAAPKTKELQISLDKAVKIDVPVPAEFLKPVAFKTPDGREGWVVRLPGGRPIATPAYADGRLFVGGGYGSHEFYALDAGSGEVVWQMKTKDDGPTAAVVEDGLVAFNTESCTVVVADAKTGKVVWQEWLGDPLMSQPAIAKGRLYMAYPGGQRGGQLQQQAGNQVPHPGKAGPPGHRMLCADLRTGKHVWETPITADVITAPVVDGDRVYFTCHDGTSFCLGALDGEAIWKKRNAGTSAPLVAGGQVLVTRKELRDGKSYEGLARLDGEAGEQQDEELLAKEKAGYLDRDGGGGVALTKEQLKAADAGVGFGSAPATAQLGKANDNIGVGTVAGGWAYQGSRVSLSGGRMMNGQGRYLNCLRQDGTGSYWRARATGTGVGDDTQVFSPPALGKRSLYLCTGAGHLLSVGKESGELGFLYATGQPMVFQPALARGNMYAGTANGLIICLKTGDEDADGWYAWGGNARHNKSD